MYSANASGVEKRVVILDPASGTANLGDHIISEEVHRIIRDAADGCVRVLPISVHQKPSAAQLDLMHDADVVIAGGSNLINFRYWPLRDGRWNNSLFSLLKMKNVILLGVGASSASDRSNLFGRYLYDSVLSRNFIHSVRDEFTANMMRGRGFSNVLNTTCPTMWSLSSAHVAEIPPFKSSKVIFTLTDYHRDYVSDKTMISYLLKSYDRVYFWPQGYYDYEYLEELGVVSGIIVVSPDVASFDAVISLGGIDYVGTRLHAGIRALQKKCRTIVVSIDNRAREISRDTGLVAIDRGRVSRLKEIIEGDIHQKIRLPEENITLWKSQLKDLLRG